MRADVLNKNSGKYDGKTNATTIFKWNYINCGSPIWSHAQSSNSSGPVTADGHRVAMLWPGDSGELYHAEMCRIGASTGPVETPVIEGTVPAIDTASTAAGLNLQLDQDTAADLGWELVPGGAPLGNSSNKYVVGTHSGYIDFTVFTAQWTTYDAISIGFRKAENFNTGHAPIVAAGTGDPLYTDFATFGLQESDKIQIATDLNNGGSGTYTDTGDTPTDSQNVRCRVSMDTDGAVTYKLVQNAVAGAGALAAPSATASFTFDSGDTVIPYVFIHGVDHADTAMLLKDIEVVRDVSVDGHSVA
jgi:hypothetical protein